MPLNALRSLALATATALFAMPAAADISFSFTNGTSQTIMYLYVSPSSAEEWGDDILGDAVVEAGETGTITLTGDECDWDIKAVFDDEAEFEDSINACTATDYTITEE
ncbi:MAG: hypothetical protein KDK12_18170 [Rhodobacteraceae bacterium]|nr:hypothetical protein [Paracoccaceae bacterium]